jgi:hypothetical protein
VRGLCSRMTPNQVVEAQVFAEDRDLVRRTGNSPNYGLPASLKDLDREYRTIVFFREAKIL